MTQDDEMREHAPRSRVAEIVSEIIGPAPLILMSVLQVGLYSKALAPTIVAALAMAIIPSLIMLWMTRTGNVSDRFVSDRRQRIPYLALNLLSFIGGAAAVISMKAPATLTWLALVFLAGLLAVFAINFFWKISIHATLATFFTGLQILLLGPLGLTFSPILPIVLWARYVLAAHTKVQLLAGTGLGGGMFVAYAWLI